MTNKGMFSSKSDEWETPQGLFDRLDAEFHFTLDPCATPDNAKCEKYFTREDDGLSQDWLNHRIFVNPPYGREISKWVKKSYEEGYLYAKAIVVMLIPARTDTKYWHDWVMQASEIRFIKGRLKFVNRTLPSYNDDGNFKVSPSPFPSAVVIFRPHKLDNVPVVKSMEAQIDG